MPTPPGFADVNVAMRHTLLSRTAFITFAVDPTATDPLLIAADVLNAITFTGSILNRLDSNVTITSIGVATGQDGGEDLVGILPATSVGGATINTLPANCAVLVHKRTALGGRRNRGRLFIPWFITQTSVGESGVIASADVTATQGALNVFWTRLQTNGCPMVLLHRPSAPGTAHPTTAGPPTVVTALVCDPLISTQRRRLGR